MMNDRDNDMPTSGVLLDVEQPKEHPPCYLPEEDNPYPCCKGRMMKACAHCCLWADYDPCEDEARVNPQLSLEQLREMDGDPAWWECGPEDSGWGIIAVDSNGFWKGRPFFQGRWHEVDFKYDIEQRGMKIYRRPPHMET